MKKICLIFTFIIAMIAITSCHRNTPESVAQRSMQAEIDGDYNTLVDLMGDHNGNALDKESSQQLKSSYEEKAKLGEKYPGNSGDIIKSFKITEQEGTEDNVVITVLVEHQDGFKESNYIPVKKGEDGIWRIPQSRY